METILQIRVDEAVIRDAETIAKRTNSTVSKLFSDFVTQLAIQQKQFGEVSSYDELVTSLRLGREQYEDGKIISHEEMVKFLESFKRE